MNRIDLKLILNKAQKSFIKSLGSDNVIKVSPVMGGEDFGRFGRQEPKIPSFLFWLGGVSKDDWERYQKGEITLASNHSPFFAPIPQPTLSTGVSAITSSAIGLLQNKK